MALPISSAAAWRAYRGIFSRSTQSWYECYAPEEPFAIGRLGREALLVVKVRRKRVRRRATAPRTFLPTTPSCGSAPPKSRRAHKAAQFQTKASGLTLKSLRKTVFYNAAQSHRVTRSNRTRSKSKGWSMSPEPLRIFPANALVQSAGTDRPETSPHGGQSASWRTDPISQPAESRSP